MSKSPKVRKLSPGTTNTSRCRKHNTNSKNRTSSKISKYFNHIQNADITLESPYKNLLSSNENMHPIEISDDCDDFKTPKPVRIAKIFEMSKQRDALDSKSMKDKKSYKARTKNNSKPGKKGLRKKKNCNLFGKSVEDDGVNAEHLDMAIALSKSEVQSVEGNNECDSDLSPNISCQEKITRFKAALEQFGFNIPNKNRTCRPRNNVTQTNKNKKSKFKYITPVLCTRTESERLELVTNKISLILNLNKEHGVPIENKKVEVSTDSLIEFYAEDADFFNKNGICLNNEDYYVPTLNIPHCEYIPGCLLRNWSDIPGRDRTPDRVDEKYLKRKSNVEECPNTIIVHENKSIEKYCDKSSLKTKPCSMEIKDEVQFINKLPSVAGNYDAACGSSSVNIIKSPDTSKASCPKNLMLSPDLFSSGEENEYPVKEIKDVNVSLIENDSVINITISQIDKLKQVSVGSDLECVQLQKLILGTNVLDASKIQENSFYLSDTNEQNIDNLYEDHLITNNKNTLHKEISYQVDKHVDLTIGTDSDCCIIENPKDVEPAKKCHLKRFSSFNSTTSVDSTASCISDTSIVISDEELNYSTINSASCKKQKSKRTLKIENIDSNLMNISTIFKELTDKLNDTSTNEKTSSDRINCNLLKNNSPEQYKSDHYNSILKTLDSIASKYIRATQEADNLNSHPRFIGANFEEEGTILEKSTVCLNSNDINHSKLADLLNSSSLLNELKILQNSPISTANVQSAESTSKGSKSANGTPSNDNLIIKTHNITPLPNYLDMDTPKIAGELKKFGLKPLKRKRGVQLLQYLYDVTHPEVPDENFLATEDQACKELGVKRLKASFKKIASISSTTISTAEKLEIVGDIIDEREPIEDLIFEHRKSVKVSTCPIPLNIAWHNLLAVNTSIRENMLMYEPLEVERVYALLKAQGFKYNVQDLITFLDRKCITIRTKQNTGKRK